MRLAPPTLLALLALALFPGAAPAAVHVWKASLSGTYASQASVTNNECGENFNTPMTAAASETATVKTTKTALVDVFRLGHGQPEVTLHDDQKPLKLAGQITRKSDLASRDEPAGCQGRGAPGGCGQKSFTSRGALFANAAGRRLRGVSISLDQNGVFDVAGGGFTGCVLGAGQSAIPYFANPKNDSEALLPLAPVPAKKLFAAHRRAFSVRGKLAHSGSEDTGSGKSDWSYVFSFTLKLTPVR